ncbi:hypothetical protein [Neorhodopirellula pilleata]|uniref:Uncharacterized protein n=1 Tax=Neorhodopirellula pilleata TaxID=2714738 RepID=A0A5C5ZNJ6_9BACT|nr:hypothetical protein [Neorhodopirellula pilleata]TWT88003.1 hypothetical protein Pla100_57330 [Neorhodopirellula pilleata]
MNRIEIESVSNVDALIDRIADAVFDRLRPLIAKKDEPRQERCASRDEMAKILGWSIAKLDRRTSEGAVPSIMDEGRRTYIVEDVFAALREGTPAAEAAAKERQAKKQAVRKSAK